MVLGPHNHRQYIFRSTHTPSANSLGVLLFLGTISNAAQIQNPIWLWDKIWANKSRNPRQVAYWANFRSISKLIFRRRIKSCDERHLWFVTPNAAKQVSTFATLGRPISAQAIYDAPESAHDFRLPDRSCRKSNVLHSTPFDPGQAS